MAEFRVEIASDTPCEACQAAIPLDNTRCPNCGAQAKYRLTFEQFFIEIEQMRIADARYGGFVVGRSGPEDDIPLYQHIGSGVFAVVGLMQGGEFIVSKTATEKHSDLLQQINSEKGVVSPSVRLEYSPYISVINTNLLPPSGGLWISWGQFIVNRFATSRHLPRLVALNGGDNRL